MDKHEKDQYQLQVENYLEENLVFEMLSTLLKEICIKQPDEPLSWLISRLTMKTP